MKASSNSSIGSVSATRYWHRCAPAHGPVRAYDWGRGTILDQEIAVEADGVVIIEGVYTLRPELRALWDLTEFLEVPEWCV